MHASAGFYLVVERLSVCGSVDGADCIASVIHHADRRRADATSPNIYMRIPNAIPKEIKHARVGYTIRQPRLAAPLSAAHPGAEEGGDGGLGPAGENDDRAQDGIDIEDH